jgi:TatA/E family protein of Tat protein translocase
VGGIGGPELLIVLLVVLLVFGPRKIPEIARMMGKGMREFRRLSTEFQRELNIADALEGKAPPGPPHPGSGGPRPSPADPPADSPPADSPPADPSR